MNVATTKRSVALAVAALLALPAVSLAQGMMMGGGSRSAAGTQQDTAPRGHGMMGYGMMGGPGMMGGSGMMAGPTPGFILAQKDALGLTAEQVARLDSLQTQSADAWRAHWALMQGIHQQMSQLSGTTNADVDRYGKLMGQMASSGAGMHLRIAKLGQAAVQVLTPDQRARLEEYARSHGRGGMHGGYGRYGMGYGGMMGGWNGPGMMGPGAMRGWHGSGMMGPGYMGGHGMADAGWCAGTSDGGSSGR